MKIGIVTVYNSQNCGSFLQAYALFKFVDNMGYDVAFAKNRISYKTSGFLYKTLIALKYLLIGQKSKAKRIYKTTCDFHKIRNKLFKIRTVSKNDICIYGSDTIWDFDNEYFNKEWRHYWGNNFGGRKIAYAPSIGTVANETILNNSSLCDCIKNFYKVGVRDKNTYSVVSDVFDKERKVEYVIDPTMLMTKEFYEKIASKCEEKDFVLFYYFGRIKSDYMNEVREYAKRNGKKIICFGDNISDVDKQLCFNPLDMMAYYSKADLIITNTFHGNVFSIIFNKPFVNIDEGKSKVNDLLENFGLSERTIDESSLFNEVTLKEIDYKKVNSILEEKRKSSGDYIKNAIEECERSLNNAG